VKPEAAAASGGRERVGRGPPAGDVVVRLAILADVDGVIAGAAFDDPPVPFAEEGAGADGCGSGFAESAFEHRHERMRRRIDNLRAQIPTDWHHGEEK